MSTFSSSDSLRTPMIIAGARTPFTRSGGQFATLMAHDLGRFAMSGLLERSKIEPHLVEHVCMGCVLADPNTSNVAREIVLESALPQSTPAHTVTMACISSNMATTTIVDMIRGGQISCGISGGVETFSDLPIRFSKELRQLLIQSKWSKTLKERLLLLSSFRPAHLVPEIPSPKEYSTGFTMGEAGDQLAARFAISRTDADEFALMSHKRSDAAWHAGHYHDQVTAVDVPPSFHHVDQDDGPRKESTLEKLGRLKPAFNPFGINTAANSSFFTDGASALLIGSRQFCRDHNYKPLASINDYLYLGGDPRHELLLGPALTIPLMLLRNHLKVSDIDVWEIHEAFAGQVLANIKAMASQQFCRERLNLDQAMGEIPLDRLNLWGGSLSLGHPFGATGARLLHTAALRLVQENGRRAIVSGCAASGLGSTILLERA